MENTDAVVLAIDAALPIDPMWNNMLAQFGLAAPVLPTVKGKALVHEGPFTRTGWIDRLHAMFTGDIGNA